MGSRGSTSSSVGGLQKQYDSLGDKMAKLAKAHSSDWASRSGQETHRQYFKIKSKRDDLRVKLNTAKDRQASKKTKSSAKSTFVNSSGEATKRYITTGTYERLRKKRNKEIMNYIGG